MKKKFTAVRGIRLKQTLWDSLQKLADEKEMGNLNHYLHKLLTAHVAKYEK